MKNITNEEEIAEILIKSKCLHGDYSKCSDFNVEYVMSDEYLRQIEYLHCAFAFFIRQAMNETQNKERFPQFIQTAKNAIKYQFFVFDFYQDYADVSRMISVEECFFEIKSNGLIEF